MSWFSNLFGNKSSQESKSETVNTGDKAVPLTSNLGNCSHCGMPLQNRTITKTAVRSNDDTRRVEQKVDVTQLFCQKCDIVHNDDYYGDYAKANQRLDQLSVKRESDVQAKELVAEMIAKAQSLTESSDTEIESDFNSVSMTGIQLRYYGSKQEILDQSCLILFKETLKKDTPKSRWTHRRTKFSR
jgi:hypothetical protein